MIDDTGSPKTEQLRRIRSLVLFNDKELATLAATLHVQGARDDEKFIEAGDIGNFSLYLLSGKAICRTVNGSNRVIKAEPEGPLLPLALGRPSQYDVIASGEVEYLRLNLDELHRFTQVLEPSTEGIEVQAIEQSDEANALTIELCHEVLKGNINLPAMPDIAFKIQKLFSDENADMAILGNLIQTDPSLSARLLQMANSSLYRGNSPVDSLNQAIVRMGLETVRKQVLVYAASEIIRKTSPSLKKRMQTLWRESRRVSAFSRILANRTKGFDPESAQMAGLLGNLGEVAIAQYVQDHHSPGYTEEAVNQTINGLRSQINGMLMHRWNLGDELVTVAEESHDWFRNRHDEADLCDLVLIARYYSHLGMNDISHLPVLSKIPAFHKLRGCGFNPGESLQFLKESLSEVELIESLLGNIV